MATQAAFMHGSKVETATFWGIVWSWLTTVDHKRIGILYGTSAFIFFLIGGIEALIMRLQLGLQILGLSSMLAGFNFLVTIINMRAPGMTLMRMPVFIWMSFVTQFLLVLAFPAITVALILLMFDRFFGNPEVYILILPSMGIVSEVLPTFSRKPLFGAPVVIYSGIMIGFFGFGVWSHHMFSVGMGPVADAAFSIATLLIAVPTGVKIFNWIGTLWG